MDRKDISTCRAALHAHVKKATRFRIDTGVRHVFGPGDTGVAEKGHEMN